MKQTTGDLSVTSEMAVSLVQSQHTSAVKRPADDMLLDNPHRNRFSLPSNELMLDTHSNHLRLPSSQPPISPTSNAKAPVSIVTQSPYKLPESYLSPVSLENTSPLQNKGLSNGCHSDEARSDDDIPALKRVRLDSAFTPEKNPFLPLPNGVFPPKKDNDYTLKTPEKALLSPKPLGFFENNTSPVRPNMDTSPLLRREVPDVSDISPQAPARTPTAAASLARALPLGYSPLPLPSTPHSLPPTPHSLASTPHSLPHSLLSKPHLLGSPSRSSDGELSTENTDPNTLSLEEEGHEVCPECQKVFKRKIYLQRHLEREHWSTAKVFKCEDCNYETKHQSNLSVHRRTHTGERPYHCGACGQRYTQGHLLKSHIRSRHQGNMELYNLDKKSDSTRGRKSLDVKHDIGTTRGDKISTLLQAAAAAGKGGAVTPKSPFPGLLPGGAGMSSYMNALSSFYGMQQPGAPLGGAGGVRGMMTSPLLGVGGNLLPGPGNRFFTLPPGLAGAGLPVSSMLPKMPPVGLGLFSSAATTHATTSSPSTKGSPTKADAVPRNMPSPPEHMLKRAFNSGPSVLGAQLGSMPVLNLSTSHLSPHLSPRVHSTPSPKPAPDVDQSALPQDLSIKPTETPPLADDSDDQPPPLEPIIITPSNQNLVISRQWANAMVSSPSHVERKEDERRSPSEGPAAIEKSISNYPNPSQHRDERAHSNSDVLPPQTPVFSDTDPETESRKSRSSSIDDAFVPEAMTESRDTISPKMYEHGPSGCSNACPHADQLKRLRRSVMQMLRCFAPEFSDKNGVDFTTPEVDNLLHDVMFSSIDELAVNNNVKSAQSNA